MSEGSIEQRDGRVTCRYERHLRHPVETAWKAITDPGEIERWTGSRPEIELRPGGQYVSYHRGGDRVVDRVTRVEPPRLFEHTFWVSINPTALVTWELSRTGEGCRLVLTHSLDIDDVRTAAQAFGNDITAILSRNGAGWHRLLDKLAGTLDGRTTNWSEQDQKILQERYAAMLQAR
jgi:uncharacterized protein YndB with AHSA1/START domain